MSPHLLQKTSLAGSFSCHFCGIVFACEDTCLLHVLSHHNTTKTPLDLSLRSSEMRAKDCKEQLKSIAKSLQSKPKYSKNTDQALLSKNYTKSFESSMKAFETNPLACRTRETVEYGEPLAKRICKSEPKSPSNELRESSLDEVAHGTDRNKRSHSNLFNDTLQSDYHLAILKHEFTAAGCRSPPTYNIQADARANRDGQAGGIGSLNGLLFCEYCDIIFLDRAMYNLHAGLHNCNSPLQCNICGKKCSTPLQFAAHVIHS
ncbi:zinc finger protein Helios-like [Watersipora subatra]|uniref:zinc finger protein Helios-like n=1 Tax=Watersipora subatra TaxID=2589382 RepID=UPI00355C829B